ncbi:hypothetical protein [Helicobacter turcicus]|uniref:Periplasmic protein n=1 Tax=Helicobacter turcicus TaxID=2867412 RepID=A0ABS7JLD9_9HELI|nr:hypothetical protein [Helicobacter turcicus]MBX7490181.1 hypothetical protein [Helicobacter turcicus]MBX7545240.1 hypothetical protein [Helicobacter turcicus]
MYNLTFHLFVFLFISFLMFPFFLLTMVFIVYERIQAYLEELRGREQQFKNIDYLISIFEDEKSDSSLLEEALNAFNEHFMHFGNTSKDSKEYQSCIDFITAFSKCVNMDIDSVVRYREIFVDANPNYKKEIETVIGSALKNREERKGKK